MVHDPVQQGHNKHNSFLSSMFMLRADVNGTEMLILLYYFNSSTVTHWNTRQVAVQLMYMEIH